MQAHLSDYEWKQLLTPGTPLNRRWCDQVDVVAGYLRQLRDAHIPVLFRPYHEMNGGWFWWGGRPGKDGSAALYRMIHDRFVNVHHLDNLVWVWNLNAPNPGWPAAEKYYPGAEYVDVVSLDVYGEFKQEFYEELVKLAGDKPLALAEVGKLPALKVLEKQPRWTYYMVWSEFIQENNPIELSRAVTHAPIAINRDDVRLSAPMEAIRKSTVERTGGKTGPQPVTEDATATVRETLQRLSDAREKGVLSGARKGAAETGKEPVIFAAEPGTGEEGWKSVLKLAQEAQAKKKIVELSWRPTRPDDGMATPLSDYEWKELLTPGSELYQKWAEGVDAVAEQLKRLNADGVAVMWAPYPEPTRKDQWWGGRHGLQGSSALYRQLFDRLVRHDGVKNLIWVWQTGASVDGALGLFDYFPGLLYVDAVELNVQKMDGWPPVGRVASLLAAGKPVGVKLQGELPQPDAGRDWSWFLVGSDPSAANRDALTRLLQAPHVVTLSEPK